MANSAGYHEPVEKLSSRTKDLHRALTSMQEELEAVDWYRQRADACEDEELRAVLLHNAEEEIEHFAMLLEWMRRRDREVDEKLHTYLFTEQDILAVEEAAEGGSADGSAADAGAAADACPPPSPRLTVGRMKE